MHMLFQFSQENILVIPWFLLNFEQVFHLHFYDSLSLSFINQPRQESLEKRGPLVETLWIADFMKE